MRIRYKYGIQTVSGLLDGLVHMAWNKGRVGVGRVFVMPTLVEAHDIFADRKTNIAAIWAECSEDFKSDMAAYATARIGSYSEDEIPAYSSYAHFVRYVYAYAEANETIDLKTATKSDLEMDGAPNNIADIILEGFLPKIEDCSAMNNSW